VALSMRGRKADWKSLNFWRIGNCVAKRDGDCFQPGGFSNDLSPEAKTQRLFARIEFARRSASSQAVRACRERI
jgi:hypothetical protein